ncbi:class I SAM-dependent methyltransferase [Flavobacterium columnare]|uniref:Methyltransferase domain-containing protein n=1 Tax=Flavobacterium columnare TaxID=996 RepID=A0AAI8GA37_9FLAO|nr:class I SAM-dependent methyltransferase [Flavobacterium columnare]AMO19114.1 methyltransferase domain-containing protein [Flavobacterium columnare]AUX17054.1 methyltransferase [Flavobacterium columnare]MEB3799888.1 methyltransferase domain-containing protein [Flavobacterium columnare]QOG56059.1 methyltransferase domain-containing protein [Flavobacterium columnare]QOG58781.1 methyltransferase domain-containing protein [Flavobacterium columnare]
MHPNCPLCKQTSFLFNNYQSRLYYECTNCKGIFLDPSQYMSSENEKKHYRFHNNDVEDKGYLHFVSPITSAVLKDFTKEDSGLDFGAGTNSAISKVLKDNQYQILQYDPYFHNTTDLLNKRYHYIASCEVIEHFHYPNKEFELLHHLLIPKGKLYCMTHLYDPSIEFNKWYYKNDHTHVFMYQKETIRWIAESFGFSDFDIINRLIIFTK